MSKRFYTIKAEAGRPAEIHILGGIGGWGITPGMVLSDVKAIAADTVDVVINSPGGDVTAAFAIYNALRYSGKVVNTRVLGIAASAGSYVFMAACNGGKRIMPKNTMLMVHNPLTDPGLANAEELRACADDLDKFQSSMLPAYAEHFKGTEEELKALLSKDTFLTADEALALGLCDEVGEAVEATASFDVEDLPEHVQAIYKAATPPVAKPDPAPQATLAERVRVLATDAGLADFASVFALDAKLTDEVKVAAAIGEAREVMALCEVAGRKDDATALIRGRKTLAEARTALVDACANADPQIRTQPRTPNAPVSTQFDPKAIREMMAEARKQQRSN